ncbi:MULTISPECIES: hypothetical protein [Campylobacter]|uniref:hypothetical protein n=1 Tax=Campylobacter TaxID=194 RepID=UPI001F093AE4|nr:MULTISPECIES: hypothetical protein [Campylobacter]EAJ5672718.1 hypothetical protein [Campylobacter lari]MCH3697933.1 hypothetical protein [Campylobacter lari]MCH3700790.1 hypothetical protein [Campylobacter lari]MCH3717659.1 hypothetical protein [Campylobacter lari]MCR2075134.1 hypothetical protein [Campylobacter lari subsp. concheus]
MVKKIISNGRKRIFDTINTKEVKIKYLENNEICITLINIEDNKFNNFRFNCLENFKDDIYKFLTEETQENLMEIKNSIVQFSYQENLILGVNQ